MFSFLTAGSKQKRTRFGAVPDQWKRSNRTSLFFASYPLIRRSKIETFSLSFAFEGFCLRFPFENCFEKKNILKALTSLKYCGIVLAY